ncbi:MAG: hypothetical protein ACSLE6_07450 [Mycobacterium sp.]
MGKAEITTDMVKALAARAEITETIANNYHNVAVTLTNWARDLIDENGYADGDHDSIDAVDALETLAERTAYDHIGVPLLARCQAGEFDGWAPIWTAPRRLQDQPVSD